MNNVEEKLTAGYWELLARDQKGVSVGLSQAAECNKRSQVSIG